MAWRGVADTSGTGPMAARGSMVSAEGLRLRDIRLHPWAGYLAGNTFGSSAAQQNCRSSACLTLPVSNTIASGSSPDVVCRPSPRTTRPLNAVGRDKEYRSTLQPLASLCQLLLELTGPRSIAAHRIARQSLCQTKGLPNAGRMGHAQLAT